MGLSPQVALAPTLWRTCRALANRRRLRITQYLMQCEERTVSEVAKDLRIPPAVTSQYLRSLNARGLLQAKRVGREVLYRVEPDPAVPQAAVLLRALGSTFRRRDGPIAESFAALTGFTHPRRIALVQALAGRPLSLTAVRKVTGMSRWAASRHLLKLVRRGYVAEAGGIYRCARPRTPLAKALLEWAHWIARPKRDTSTPCKVCSMPFGGRTHRSHQQPSLISV